MTSGGGEGCLPRAARLVSAKDFRRVQRAGRRGGSARGRGFVVFAAPARNRRGVGAELVPERTRLGVTVSRRVGKAVVRNRVKRRIRAWFRSYRGGASRRRGGGGAIDLVVVARSFAPEMNWRGVRSELCALAERAAAACRTEGSPGRRRSSSG